MGLPPQDVLQGVEVTSSWLLQTADDALQTAHNALCASSHGLLFSTIGYMLTATVSSFRKQWKGSETFLFPYQLGAYDRSLDEDGLMQILCAFNRVIAEKQLC